MKNKNIRLFILLLPLIVLLLAFLVVPLSATIISSFISEDGRLTFEYYKEGFNRIYFDAMKTSLILSICVTVIGTVIGSFVAYCISKANPKFKQFLMNLASLPLTLSGLVIAYIFIITLGSSGSVTLILQKLFNVNPLSFSAFLFTWKGLMIAYLYFQIPRMIVIMATTWEKLDKSLVEAARSLGASSYTVIVRVVLPYLRAPLITGSVLLFAISMGAFGTALALTGTQVGIFPLLIQNQFSDVGYNPKLANALAVMLSFVTTIAIFIYQKNFSKEVESN